MIEINLRTFGRAAPQRDYREGTSIMPPLADKAIGRNAREVSQRSPHPASTYPRRTHLLADPQRWSAITWPSTLRSQLWSRVAAAAP